MKTHLCPFHITLGPGDYHEISHAARWGLLRSPLALNAIKKQQPPQGVDAGSPGVNQRWKKPCSNNNKQAPGCNLVSFPRIFFQISHIKKMFPYFLAKKTMARSGEQQNWWSFHQRFGCNEGSLYQQIYFKRPEDFKKHVECWPFWGVDFSQKITRFLLDQLIFPDLCLAQKWLEIHQQKM